MCHSCVYVTSKIKCELILLPEQSDFILTKNKYAMLLCDCIVLIGMTKEIALILVACFLCVNQALVVVEVEKNEHSAMICTSKSKCRKKFKTLQKINHSRVIQTM